MGSPRGGIETVEAVRTEHGARAWAQIRHAVEEPCGVSLGGSPSAEIGTGRPASPRRYPGSVQREQQPWELAQLSPEEKARVRKFDQAYREAVLWVEGFACNQPGQDKSWVARVEENDRRYFSKVRLATEELERT